MYSEMNDYQKNFLSDAQVDTLKKYVAKMKDLVAVAESEGSEGDDAGKDDTGKDDADTGDKDKA